jgi:hypothetical protein
MWMGLLSIQQRKYDEAIRELKIAVDLADRSTETLAALATAHTASGDVTNARTILDEVENPAGRRYVLPYNIAKIYAAMGDADRVFVWLDTSHKKGNPDLIELNSEPVFDGISRRSKVSGIDAEGWRKSETGRKVKRAPTQPSDNPQPAPCG